MRAARVPAGEEPASPGRAPDGPSVELAGTLLLSAAMWLVAGLTWRERRSTRGAPRVLVGVATPRLANAVGFALCSVLAWRLVGVTRHG
jgi:hypothetical protein